MEAIIVIVGFLGAGKTTLLKQTTRTLIENNWSPFIILNDYENASLDAQSFLEFLSPSQVKAMSGSCICCSGLIELRQQVNNIPARSNPVTLIEANGTTDACALLEFLGVGINERFLPPIQIAVVDARLWQERGQDNELELNQVQAASLIVLNYTDKVSAERLEDVKGSLGSINPAARLLAWEDLTVESFLNLKPTTNQKGSMQHSRSHWSSCSIDLPDPLLSVHLQQLLERLPQGIVRVKGCTRLDDDDYYSFFETTPSGETFVKRYRGKLVSGPKLLTVGPGSDPDLLSSLLSEVLR